MVDHQKMIADTVETIDIAPVSGHFGRRLRAHLFVEDAIAQRLRGIDLGGIRRQPDLQGFESNVDNGL